MALLGDYYECSERESTLNDSVVTRTSSAGASVWASGWSPRYLAVPGIAFLSWVGRVIYETMSQVVFFHGSG
jgi:hypothetical protein